MVHCDVVLNDPNKPGYPVGVQKQVAFVAVPRVGEEMSVFDDGMRCRVEAIRHIAGTSENPEPSVTIFVLRI